MIKMMMIMMMVIIIINAANMKIMSYIEILIPIQLIRVAFSRLEIRLI
jgi:hypothetical protein